MASTPSKSKKARTKPPRGRPAATSTISQPAVEDHSTLTYLPKFSPSGDLFAFLSLAVDKHRLRVYDTNTHRSIAEHVVDTARVSSLCWARLDLANSQNDEGDDTDAASQPKRKRKKRHSQAASPPDPAPAPQVVVLGLSDGTLSLFSPSHGRVVRTLSHPSSTTAIHSVAVDESADARASSIWTSSPDGNIRHWDASKNDLVGSWNSDNRIPYSCLSLRPPTGEEGHADVLVAHHAIRLLSVTTSSESQLTEKNKPKELARFTGHATPVQQLQWNGSSRFLSMAEADRVVYVWDVPDPSQSEGRTVASIPLDSDARSFALSSTSLLTLSASGKISIFPLPTDLGALNPSKGKQKVLTLNPKSTIAMSAKKNVGSAQVVAASFVEGKESQIRVARLANGIQPVFDVVPFLDASGNYIEEVTISDSGAGLVAGDSGVAGAPTQRYAESSSLAIRSGAELGQDATMDDLPMRDVDGDLDVDLAELTLGQRLTALNGNEALVGRSSESSDEEEDAPPSGSGAHATSKQRRGNDAVEAIPANSLTRTLIQALHSSDARLLETCLAHSDATLIRNTVRRLPPQLAVPLITACVERLGRGAGGARMKGGGGGASSQRGTAMIKWIKAAIAAHSGHLMTMPDLVARLSGLHATVTTRLALQDSLLALNGRLDMVISQIEMRSSGAPAPLQMPKGKARQKQRRRVQKYVEGESEEEEAGGEGMEVEVEVEVEVESGEEEGSVEDVELGGDDEDEEEDEEDEKEEEDEKDEDEDSDEDDYEDDDGEPKMNGFIDDEAEEYSGEDSDESE